jgi:hypothetical protein
VIDVARRATAPAELAELQGRAARARRAERLLTLSWLVLVLVVGAVIAPFSRSAALAWTLGGTIMVTLYALPMLLWAPKPPRAGTLLTARVRAARVLLLAEPEHGVFGFVFEDADDPKRLLYVHDYALARKKGWPNSDFTIEYFVGDDGLDDRRRLELRGAKLKPLEKRLIDDLPEDKPLPEQLSVLRGPLESLRLG